MSDDGAVYKFLMYFDCIGIVYNKTLLETHGWPLPTLLQELEELAPQVEAAGCRLCLNEIQYRSYGFQYFCNILDTGFLNTPDGHIWQSDFLSGSATVAGTSALVESMQVLERWRDLGMLNGSGDPENDENTHQMMAEGNTLFLLGSDNTFTQEETTDEFALMPYLSEDCRTNELHTLSTPLRSIGYIVWRLIFSTSVMIPKGQKDDKNRAVTIAVAA